MGKKLLTIFGASGLVGSSILREALDRGYHVNGTLRDIENQDRITRLKSLPSGNNASFFSSNMAEGVAGGELGMRAARAPFLVVLVSKASKNYEKTFQGR